jgi:signal transduction histidine kinase
VDEPVAGDSHPEPGHVASDEPETTIQLCVADDRDRELLGSFLAEWTTPVIHETIQDADLFLVDQVSLAQYRTDLLTHKREQDPVFCPVLLLSHEPSRHGDEVVDIGASAEPVLVDETLQMPVKKAVLTRRLRNLLARRTQTQLLQAKTDRLDQFASKLSHELRNPLNLLSGYLPIAHEEQDQAAFEACQTAITRMDRMVSDMLLLARDGEMAIEPHMVSFSDVVDTAWGAVEGPQARLEVTTDRRLYADEDRLLALLANLFRNAVEHGGAEVTVTAGRLPDGFFVADDGVGIPVAERETVFDDGHTTGGDGIGVGLSVVAEIVAAHGWEITVRESPEGGARFEITGVASSPDEAHSSQQSPFDNW